MKYYALLDVNNLVINTSIADDNWDATGWIEYTNKNCGIGYIYDEVRDSFIPPKCHDEATLNNNCLWDCTNADHDPLVI
jgi:hypothetical protein